MDPFKNSGCARGIFGGFAPKWSQKKIKKNQKKLKNASSNFEAFEKEQ